MNRLLAAFLLLLARATVVGAADGTWDLSASLGGELRWFVEDAMSTSQLDGAQPSLQFEPEATWRSESRRHRFRVAGFLRIDESDEERTHLDLREAYYQHVGTGWDVLVGVGRVFWGVTESRHLIDVINQDDLVEDVDGEDKLGQPMINVGFQRNWGRVDAYALIGFRQPTFPGEKGRLRPPLPVDPDGALWESSAEDERLDFALRYTHFVGDWDFGFYLFEGTGREPRFEPDAMRGRIVPSYSVITQVGFDGQYTRGAWLSKLEVLVREGHGKTFAAFVGGVEYTFFQTFGSGIDVGVLFELLYDGRDHEAPSTPFEDDLFIGSRVGFNDVRDTALLLGVVFDREDGSKAGRLELERRINSWLALEVESRWFAGFKAPDPLAAFEADSFVAVRLTTFL